MRILVVTQYFWPETFRINDLVSALAGRGHEIVVLTGKPNYPDGRIFDEFSASPERFREYRGAEIVRVPLIPRGSGGPIRLTLNYLSFSLVSSILGPWRLRGREFDAIFVYEPSPVTVGLPAVALSWLKGSPIAFWVLDLWPETLAALGVIRSKAALRCVGAMVSFIYNRCGIVLVQSRQFIPSILNYLTRPGCTDSVAYFPSWADPVPPDDGATAAELPWRPDLFTVLFTGNVGEAQDFPSILDAAERMEQEGKIRWVIVGDGRAMNWVRSEVARRGLKTVVLAGRHPVERMPSFYRHAQALLVTLRPDGVFRLTIPAKVQSYLKAGLPIIGMLDGEGARVIEEAGAGLTCPAGDAEALAAAVRRIVSMDPESRAAMGRLGEAYSNREFDRDTLVSRLESHLAAIRPPGKAAS